MDKAQREQLLATKERLHQTKVMADEEEERSLTNRGDETGTEEVAREKGKATQQKVRTRLEAEKEKARLNARARQEEENLSCQGKTVSKGTSQVAILNQRRRLEKGDERADDEEGSVGSEPEDSSSEEQGEGELDKDLSIGRQKGTRLGRSSNLFHGK